MERIENGGDTVIRYDDDINKVGINLVVKAIRSRYHFVVGYRVRTISSVIFIELKVDSVKLGEEMESGREISYLSNFFDIDREEDEKIKKLVEELYKELPEDIVNFHYAKYGWSDKEYKHRSGLYLIGYYIK